MSNRSKGRKGPYHRQGGAEPTIPDVSNAELRQAIRQALLGGQLRRQAQPNGNADPRTLGGEISGPGGPHDQGAFVLDTTDCVLMDNAVVSVMDEVRAGQLGERVIYMTLGGRVNQSTDRAQVGFTLGPDGAAALITELLALADRAGPELLDDVTRRLTKLHQEKNVDLPWLRAAIDNAIERNEE